MKREVVSLIVAAALVAPTTAASAANLPAAPAPTPMIECPNHTHVWNQQQCDNRPPFGIGPPGGAGNGGGLLGTIGRVLGGLSGGIL